MGKNHDFVVIRVKFWWMIPMGVRNNRTKSELETQWWLPGMGDPPLWVSSAYRGLVGEGTRV